MFHAFIPPESNVVALRNPPPSQLLGFILLSGVGLGGYVSYFHPRRLPTSRWSIPGIICHSNLPPTSHFRSFFLFFFVRGC